MVTINAEPSRSTIGAKLWTIGWWTLVSLGFLWMASGLITGIIGWWASLPN